ncbi:MAG: response regulator transcription factor [Pseudomonadota bacterium]|nr:response regulator transcription factor [Pseudomonadota bacterium]
MQKVLVVDDDAHIRDVVCFALRREGFDAVEASTGRTAIQKFETEQPDLVVLDVLMPEGDGIAVCEQIRQSSAAPIIFLSSKDAEADRIKGLDIGGDDYVTKPFSVRELVARVKAHLRRLQEQPKELDSSLSIGPLNINVESRAARIDNETLDLTRTEFDLLTAMAREDGKVLAREKLMSGAYAANRIVSDRTIDSHIRRLRKKLRNLGVDPIHTVHGVGFRLSFE